MGTNRKVGKGVFTPGRSFRHVGVALTAVSLVLVGGAGPTHAVQDHFSLKIMETSPFIGLQVKQSPQTLKSVLGIPGDSRVKVSWVNPQSNRDLRISRFTATATPGGRSCTVVRANSCTVQGLSNGIKYRFSVTATNLGGTSKPSRLSPEVTPRTVPTAPMEILAKPGDGHATVSWIAPQSNGGARIRQYQATSIPGNFRCVTRNVQFCLVKGLSKNVSYTFVVTASNIAGTSLPSSRSNSVIPGAVPSAPVGIQAKSGDSFVALSWKPPISTGDSPITSYKAVSSPGNFQCTTQGEMSCVFAGLTNGTAYTFEVTAINAVGPGTPGISEPISPSATSTLPGGGGATSPSSESPPPNASLPADEGITGLSSQFVAAYNASGTVWVTWNRPVVSGLITGFDVGVSTRETGSPRIGSCETEGAQSCSISGLSPSSTYYVTVAPKISGVVGQKVTSPQPTTPLQAGDVQFINSIVASPAIAPVRLELRSKGATVSPSDACPSGDRYDYESWSPDGRYMAFNSDSSILVEGDTNCIVDIFIQDVLTGNVQRISESADGVEVSGEGAVGGDSFWSPDGQWLAFWSSDASLVPGINDSTNKHLYIKRIADGAVYQVDTNEDGQSANGSGGLYAYWSPDSSKIAFLSSATNLIPGDDFALAGFYVKDLASGSIARVSEGTDGEQTDSWVGEPPAGFASNRQFWSADGSLIAFISGSDALVPGDTNGRGDVFVKNLETGELVRASVDEDGNQFLDVDCTIEAGWSPFGNRLLFGCSGSLHVRDFDAGTAVTLDDVRTNRPAWSPDGRLITYVSATTGFYGDVKVWDVAEETSTFLARSTYMHGPVFSPDGSRIAYVGDDFHMWVKDLETLDVIQADTTEEGTSGDGGVNTTPKWSPDSARLSFESTSTNLTSISGSFPQKLFVKVLPNGTEP